MSVNNRGKKILLVDDDQGLRTVLAEQLIHRPLKFEQDFDVSVRVAEMSSRAIRYAGIIVGRAGKRVATATWKIACVSKLPDGSMKSTDIPADVAERLKPFA